MNLNFFQNHKKSKNILSQDLQSPLLLNNNIPFDGIDTGNLQYMGLPCNNLHL